MQRAEGEGGFSKTGNDGKMKSLYTKEVTEVQMQCGNECFPMCYRADSLKGEHGKDFSLLFRISLM